jgi:hypothetical protein
VHADDCTETVRFISDLMTRFGLQDRWAYRDVASDGQVFGLSAARFADLLENADVVVNPTGATRTLISPPTARTSARRTAACPRLRVHTDAAAGRGRVADAPRLYPGPVARPDLAVPDVSQSGIFVARLVPAHAETLVSRGP